MEGSTWNLLLTLLANALADRLTPAQLVQAATLVTQLGTTLGFLAAQQAAEGSAPFTVSSPAQTASGREPTGKPPFPGSTPSPQNPAEPEAFSATGR